MNKKIFWQKTKLYETIKGKVNKKHIAVFMGGMSGEREVSLSSGSAIVKTLVEIGYNVTPIDVGYDISEILLKVKPDIVFNALHGTFGEDGAIPGMLELMGIPYTHSGVTASAICFDKVKARIMFQSAGLKCAEAIVINKNDKITSDPLPRPYVIKPISEGSSLGISIIFEKDNFDIRDYEWLYGDTVLVERYIPGREIQVAVLESGPLAVLEIKPLGRFYDYEAKYTEGKAEHILPAQLAPDIYNKAMQLAYKAHKIVGCRSMSRVEFRYDDTEGGDGELYILEINTHPGFTPLSIVPEIAAYKGISFAQLLEILISEAKCDWKSYEEKDCESVCKLA